MAGPADEPVEFDDVREDAKGLAASEEELLLLALFGTFSIDAKRRRKMGAAWEGFAAQTSNIPFGAVIRGRTPLHLSENFGWRFWVALILFVAILFAHAHIFGVSPFPGGAVPV